MLRTRRLHPSLFLAGLITLGLVVWLAETEQNLRDSNAPSLPPQDADYYMENFHLSETDAEGHILRQLSGAHLTHFISNRTELQLPQLTLHEQQQQRWRVTANNGQLVQQNLTLQEDVRIQQLNVTNEQPLLVTTDNLNIDMQNRVSYSAGKVEIAQGNATIKAEGMHLLFDDRQLQLQSRVRGVYVPQ